jgi:serine/threonine-protein kinase
MPSGRDLNAGKLAVKNSFLTEAQVKEVLDHIDARKALGASVLTFEDIAKEKGLLGEREHQALSTAMKRFEKDSERKTMSVEGYEILQKIGEGGLATVYKARQISMNRIVALKILQKQWLADEEFKKRFLLEARLVGKLSHENLIKVFDVGKEDWKYYYSMEFIEGETCEDIVEREGPMDPVRVLRISSQIAKAIEYLRTYNIVHCDIKPGNIMITKTGAAKLADFGFVRVNLELNTEEGAVLGTPDYISPEQAMGKDEIDYRSDIYSLGASIYHMLAGRPPFDGTSSEIMRAHIRKEIPPISNFMPGLTHETIALIGKMLAKDPAERYQTVPEMLADLNKAIIAEDPDAGDVRAGEHTLYDAFKREKMRTKQQDEERIHLLKHLHDYRLFFYIALALLFISFIVNLILLLKVVE